VVTPRIFDVHFKAYSTDLIVKCEWPPNSPDFNHLTIDVRSAMLQTFYKLSLKLKIILELKGALQQIRDDFSQIFAISSERMCFGLAGDNLFKHQI